MTFEEFLQVAVLLEQARKENYKNLCDRHERITSALGYMNARRLRHALNDATNTYRYNNILIDGLEKAADEILSKPEDDLLRRRLIEASKR